MLTERARVESGSAGAMPRLFLVAMTGVVAPGPPVYIVTGVRGTSLRKTRSSSRSSIGYITNPRTGVFIVVKGSWSVDMMTPSTAGTAATLSIFLWNLGNSDFVGFDQSDFYTRLSTLGNNEL